MTFVIHLNNRIDSIKVWNWLYTEACTGKGRIDTHLSHLNLKLKAYIINGNDIRAEDDIYTVIPFEGGLVGTSEILFDGSNSILQSEKFIAPPNHLLLYQTIIGETLMTQQNN